MCLHMLIELHAGATDFLCRGHVLPHAGIRWSLHAGNYESPHVAKIALLHISGILACINVPPCTYDEVNGSGLSPYELQDCSREFKRMILSRKTQGTPTPFLLSIGGSFGDNP